MSINYIPASAYTYTYIIYTEFCDGDEFVRYYYGADDDKARANKVACEIHGYIVETASLK